MEAAFNEWDYLPISLNRKQIDDPLKAITDFFDDDSLDGHLKRLVRWREFVLKDDYYKTIEEPPHSVYYFYKLTLKLIDAAYMILKAWPDNGGSIALPSLSAVYQKLDESERLEIYSALSSFFSDFNLPQYREQLTDWVEYALSSSAANEFITTADLVTVYENLQSFFSATWILHFHNREVVASGENLLSKERAVNEGKLKEGAIYKLDHLIQPGQKETITQLVNRIKFKVATVQTIIYLGRQPGSNGKLYFLVITSNNEQRLSQSLASMIEESCLEIAPIVAIVNHASKLLDRLADDNLFYNHALNCPLVYMTGELMLPAAKPLKVCYSNSATSFIWQRWFSQGKDFLLGADFYLRNHRFGAALFSLHQCAECLLTAVIRGVLGYETNSHNLSRLLMVTGMFTADLLDLFDLSDPDVKARFEILKHAFINVSYRDQFEPDTKAIAILYQDIAQLMNCVELVYQNHLLVNSL